MSNSYADAVADIAEVFMFEHWLRHHYVVEKDGTLFLEIPPEDLKAIYEKHEHLGPLADMFNNAEITYETSQSTVCAFVGARYDGSKYGPDVVARTLDSKAFKIEMYVFNVWLKGHQSFLDAEKKPFGEWQEMYEGWNSMAEVKDYRRRLAAGGGLPGQPTSCSVH